MPRSVEIVQDEEKGEVPVEVIAQAILDIGKSMRRISQSRLNRDALITLICADCKLPQYQVKAVLDSLDSLEKTYLTKK